jgi:hypothetical protein
MEEGYGDRESGPAGEKLLGTIDWIDHEADRGSENRRIRIPFFTNNGGLWGAIVDRRHQNVFYL